MIESHRLFHPLCGADPWTLLQIIYKIGPGASLKPPVAVALAASFAKLPLTVMERLYVALPRTKQQTAPVFIVGHWRSGTTHLYNIMTKSSRWSYVTPFATALPWDFLILARLLAPLLRRALPRHRFIDNVEVNPDSPQEDEIGLANMTPVSFYHALYFPQRFAELFNSGVFCDGLSEQTIAAWVRTLQYYYKKLALSMGGLPLLIKNPVYTARIGQLRQLWPEAKFIHIHRNPYQVFLSMRNFYEKLLAEFAIGPVRPIDIDTHILTTYERMMRRLVNDVAHIPRRHFVELSYELLRDAPLEAVDQIHDALDLDLDQGSRSKMKAYLAKISAYETNRYNYPEEVRARVGAHLKTYIERWSYAAPS